VSALQAATLWSRITSPNVLGIASSKLGQSSYAHHIDTTIGQHVVDEVSFYLHQFLTTHVPAHPAASPGSAATAAGSSGSGGSARRVPSMQQLVDFIFSQRLSSELQVRTDLYPRPLVSVPVTHFFGAAVPAERQAAAPGSPPAATCTLFHPFS
jgi:phosphatidylinositol glycan class K